MLVCRDSLGLRVWQRSTHGRWLLAVCSALALAACTKSHDIEVNGESLNPDKAGTSARAGSGGSGGRASGGAGGRAGSAGPAAGRTGGTAGTGITTGATGGSGMIADLPCGMCTSASIFGILTTPACCTDDDKCGLDLTSIGQPGCAEAGAQGNPDASCPSTSLMGIATLQGCCRPDGTCGSLDTFLGLGCTSAAGTEKQSCTPQ